MRYLLAALMLVAGCAEAHPQHAVTIELDNGKCSATKVGPNVIMTAAHCFDGTRLVGIDGKPAYALKIIRDGQDHALVRVSAKFAEWARMGPEPKQGDRLTLVGNIWGIGLMRRELVVSGDVTLPVCPFKLDPCRMILSEGTVDGGDSGSGYFNTSGRLVGVHTGTIGKNAHLAVMFPLAFTEGDWLAIR